MQAAEEQLAVPPDDGQKVVEVVRDAARQAADGLHLLRLAEQLLAASQRFFRLLALAQVADEAGEQAQVIRRIAAQGELDRKLAAVLAHGGDLDAPAEHAAFTRGALARQAGPVLLAQGRRHDQLCQLAAQRLGARVSEHALGRRVELGDPPLVIDGDDRVERHAEDVRLARLAAPQRLLRLLAAGHILDRAFVVQAAPLLVADRAGAEAGPDGRAVPPAELDLDTLHDSLALEIRGPALAILAAEVQVRRPHLEERFAVGVAEDLHQCRVGVQDAAIGRGQEQSHRGATEEAPVAFLGLAQGAPRLGPLQGPLDGRRQAAKVLGRLEDIVVHASLHRLDGDLFAAGAGEHDDRNARVAGLEGAQDRQPVGRAHVVIGDHHVGLGGAQGLFVAARPIRFHQLQVREVAAELVRDQGAVIRVVVEEQDAGRQRHGDP